MPELKDIKTYLPLAQFSHRLFCIVFRAVSWVCNILFILAQQTTIPSGHSLKLSSYVQSTMTETASLQTPFQFG